MDAKHLTSYLDIVKEDGSINEAIRQIALADKIILNKTDLVGLEDLVSIESKIRFGWSNQGR